MNADGYPHTNREFKRLLVRVKHELLDAGISRRHIERVIRRMAHHEDVKRLRHPQAARDGSWRTPVPPKLVDSVLHFDRQLRAAS